MDGKVKIGLIAVVLGVVAVAFLASPIQAYMNGDAQLLQTRDQERDRLRTQEQDCDGGALQAQTRDQFRMHAHGCDCDGTQKQNRFGPKTLPVRRIAFELAQGISRGISITKDWTPKLRGAHETR